MTDERCPELVTKSTGDEATYFCRLTEKFSGRIHPCHREYGEKCEEYDLIMRELAKEKTLGDVLIETAKQIREN